MASGWARKPSRLRFSDAADRRPILGGDLGWCVLLSDVESSVPPDRLRGFALPRKPDDVVRQHVFLRWSDIDAKAGILRKSRNRLVVRKHHSLADPHHADRDAGGLSCGRVAQV